MSDKKRREFVPPEMRGLQGLKPSKREKILNKLISEIQTAVRRIIRHQYKPEDDGLEISTRRTVPELVVAMPRFIVTLDKHWNLYDEELKAPKTKKVQAPRLKSAAKVEPQEQEEDDGLPQEVEEVDIDVQDDEDDREVYHEEDAEVRPSRNEEGFFTED